MQHLLAVAAHLGLVPVLLAVEVAVEIVAVLAPRHGGHHGDMVAMLAPAANARGHGGVDPVDHRRIRREVDARRPFSLRACLFPQRRPSPSSPKATTTSPFRRTLRGMAMFRLRFTVSSLKR